MSLYHTAAEALTAPASDGGNLKSRIFQAPDKAKLGQENNPANSQHARVQPSQVYALASEAIKWSSILKEVIDRSELLRHERKLTPMVSLLLVHDLLLSKTGITLPQSHRLRASVERHRARLSAELTRARLRRKAASLQDLRNMVEQAAGGGNCPKKNLRPRWVRVNTLRTSLQDQLETTFSQYERVNSIDAVCAPIIGASGVRIPKPRFCVDEHVPNLLAVSPWVDLVRESAYKTGALMLQDKASCFTAYILDPRPEDGDVVDACAAPGNKTTHLAAILQERQLLSHPHSPQLIHAFERVSERAETLRHMVRRAGAANVVCVGIGQDFLRVDPAADAYCNVGVLLLDPSCSGSGMIGRDDMPIVHLPSSADVQPPGSKLRDGTTSRKRKRQRDHKVIPVADSKLNTELVEDGQQDMAVTTRTATLQARLTSLAAFQLRIVKHAFAFPAARRVAYSTCSVHEEENEGVVVAALSCEVAVERGWAVLPRARQPRGMREWPVRGRQDACGDEALADACVRTNANDGRGTIGFFAVVFVRTEI